MGNTTGDVGLFKLKRLTTADHRPQTADKGRTNTDDGRRTTNDDVSDGSAKGNVWGTYIQFAISPNTDFTFHTRITSYNVCYTKLLRPRGTVSFDTKTNTTLCPLFEAKLIEKNGFCEIEIEKSITNYKEEFEKLTSFELENINSAWYNSYTCI